MRWCGSTRSSSRWRGRNSTSSRTRCQEIARLAKVRDTGARGLRAIVEEMMLDMMYDLPDLETKGRHTITLDHVRGRRNLGRLPAPATVPLHESIPEARPEPKADKKIA